MHFEETQPIDDDDDWGSLFSLSLSSLSVFEASLVLRCWRNKKVKTTALEVFARNSNRYLVRNGPQRSEKFESSCH